MTATQPQDASFRGATPWWKTAVFYQIYPRSFAASNPAATEGDLRGILSKLDYLKWLGVDALWLSPFYPSPMHDGGYDCTDHCGVDPRYGSLEDFDALLEAAHARGMRVIIDWVGTYTAAEHRWFQEARQSRDNPRRDWYVWRDPGPDGRPPNNWRGGFGDLAPTWTLDETTGQFYLHTFMDSQPDLNWDNPEVVEAMLAGLRFWLDRGVDGFRADVVHNLCKPDGLPDVPEHLAHLHHVMLNETPKTHAVIRQIRELLDGYPGQRMMVGEIFVFDAKQAASYAGPGELHLGFNFAPLFMPWSASALGGAIRQGLECFDEVGGWPSWVLSNHDQPRHRSRYGSEAKARAAAVLLVSLRGTPFLYQGEELGLEDARITPETQVDPGFRDGSRAPIPWDCSERAGWGSAPWLPLPPDHQQRNPVTMKEDPESTLQLYRRLLEHRRSSACLRFGVLDELRFDDDSLSFVRRHAAQETWVAVNFRDRSVDLSLPEGLRVSVASDGKGEGEPYPGRLEPDQALILERCA